MIAGRIIHDDKGRRPGVGGSGQRNDPQTGCLMLNVAQGTVKRHAGGYSWETQVGGSVSARIGFWGATQIVQPSGAAQAAVT